jgi:hypothetical protein
MTRRLISAAVGTGLIGLTVALSQTANAEDQLVAPPAPMVTPPAPMWWTGAEALVWDVKSTPLPPTLTTFAPGSLSATTGFGGELGVAGTSVLSPSNLGYGMAPGARFTIGRWLDAYPLWGVEAQGFFLESGSANFAASSSGSPSLRVPFNNVPPGDGFPVGPSSFVLADPGFASGSQTISSTLHFWGAEGNVFYRAVDSGPYHVSVLGGVRYLELREGLSITSDETLIGGGGSYSGNDNFSTRNMFFGGQAGVKAQAQFDQFDGTLIAKVALGDDNQTVTADGTSVASGFGLGSAVAPGGIFTQTTNIGQQSRNTFTVVPEVQFQLGYSLPYGIRAFVGYDFIYMGNVVRPGNQIDTTLNFTSNPVVSGPGVAAAGAARPQPMFERSSFWTQGLNVGLTFSF